MARVPGFIKRAPRIDLKRPAVLIDSTGAESVVTVLDVSSGGFKLQISETPRIGDIVVLRVDGSDDIQAQIRWAVGDQAGGVFLTEVDYSAMP
jgi:PilZ domain